jgi:hypothetical protein
MQVERVVDRLLRDRFFQNRRAIWHAVCSQFVVATRMLSENAVLPGKVGHQRAVLKCVAVRYAGHNSTCEQG